MGDLSKRVWVWRWKEDKTHMNDCHNLVHSTWPAWLPIPPDWRSTLKYCWAFANVVGIPLQHAQHYRESLKWFGQCTNRNDGATRTRGDNNNNHNRDNNKNNKNIDDDVWTTETTRANNPNLNWIDSIQWRTLSNNNIRNEWREATK